jgi:hypothetical protein
MFVDVFGGKNRNSKIPHYVVLVSCQRRGVGGRGRALVLSVPLQLAAVAGRSVDVAVGKIGTEHERMLLIKPGDSLAVTTVSPTDTRGRIAIRVSDELPLVRAVQAEYWIAGGALIVVVPPELQQHYEDLARRAEEASAGSARLNQALGFSGSRS